MRLLFYIFLCFYLSGCQSFIANQIIKPIEPLKVTGLDSENSITGVVTQHCSDKINCLTFRFFSTNDLSFKDYPTHRFSLVIGNSNGDDITFSETISLLNQHVKLTNELLVIFPGYGIDNLIYGMQARWLSHITGKDTIVMPAANQYEEFKFGLNHLEQLNDYIQQNKYQKVSLLSYSMGSVAAMNFSKMALIDKNIMVAPMIDFSQALSSTAHLFEPTLSKFFSESEFNGAAQDIVKQSGLTELQLNVKELINTQYSTLTDTVIYTSEQDSISPTSYWQDSERKKVTLVSYPNQSHMVLVALAEQALRTEISHRLLTN